MKQSSDSSDGKMRCAVCYQSAESSTEKIIRCQVCGVCVHPSCYGCTCTSKSHSIWKCRYCKHCTDKNIDGKKNKYSVQCGICDQKAFGALKKCDHDDGEFAHLVCALLTPWVYVRKEYQFSPIHNMKQCEQLKPALASMLCSVCGKGNATIKCRVKGCNCHYHPICYMEKHNDCLIKSTATIQKVQSTMYHVYCPEHKQCHQAFAKNEVDRTGPKKRKAVFSDTDQESDEAQSNEDVTSSKPMSAPNPVILKKEPNMPTLNTMDQKESADDRDDMTFISYMSVDEPRGGGENNMNQLNVTRFGRDSSPFGHCDFNAFIPPLPSLDQYLSPSSAFCGGSPGLMVPSNLGASPNPRF